MSIPIRAILCLSMLLLAGTAPSQEDYRMYRQAWYLSKVERSPHQALTTLRELIRKYPRSSLRLKAYYRIVEINLQLGKWKPAEEAMVVLDREWTGPEAKRDLAKLREVASSIRLRNTLSSKILDLRKRYDALKRKLLRLRRRGASIAALTGLDREMNGIKKEVDLLRLQLEKLTLPALEVRTRSLTSKPENLKVRIKQLRQKEKALRSKGKLSEANRTKAEILRLLFPLDLHLERLRNIKIDEPFRSSLYKTLTDSSARQIQQMVRQGGRLRWALVVFTLREEELRRMPESARPHFITALKAMMTIKAEAAGKEMNREKAARIRKHWKLLREQLNQQEFTRAGQTMAELLPDMWINSRRRPRGMRNRRSRQGRPGGPPPGGVRPSRPGPPPNGEPPPEEGPRRHRPKGGFRQRTEESPPESPPKPR